MSYRKGTAKLTGLHYGYKRRIRVKVLEASNLPDSPSGEPRLWIDQGEWKDDPVGALLDPGDYTDLVWEV